MITIVPYNPAWPAEFAKIGEKLRLALGDLVLRIDHIGSTSIPNIEAKDIIDIQLTVPSFDRFDPVRTTLVALGYTEFVGATDHRPPGATGPASDWEKRYFSPPAGQRPTHMHVRAMGRPNQRYPLLFRDYLRSHSGAAAAYAALKQQLAHYHGHTDDHTAYVDIKDPVCDIIISAAEDWATDTGWQLGPSDA